MANSGDIHVRIRDPLLKQDPLELKLPGSTQLDQLKQKLQHKYPGAPELSALRVCQLPAAFAAQATQAPAEKPHCILQLIHGGSTLKKGDETLLEILQRVS